MRRSLLLSLFLIPLALSAADFESPTTLDAADVLPAESLTTDLYEIDTEVANDGVLNTYLIHTRYGDFTATGTPMLHSRLREIMALSELEAISKSDVYLQGAKEAGIDMAKGFGYLFTDPVGSVKSVPSGVSRMLGSTWRGMKRGAKWTGEQVGLSDEPDLTREEDLRRQHDLVSNTEREWAQELRIDPYTSNERLRAAISDMAWVDTLGDWTTGLVASVVVPVAGLTTTVSVLNSAVDDIYNEDPKALRAKNRGILEQAGAEAAVIDAFLASGWYSPTLQTLMIRTLAEAEHIDNRWLVLEKAMHAGNEAQARFFAQSLLAAVWYAQEVEPIEHLVEDDRHLITARSASDHYLVFVPADYLLWTEDVATAERAASAWADEQSFAGKDLIVMETLSPLARESFESRGWTVHERIDDQTRHLIESIAQGASSAEQTAEGAETDN